MSLKLCVSFLTVELCFRMEYKIRRLLLIAQLGRGGQY